MFLAQVGADGQRFHLWRRHAFGQFLKGLGFMEEVVMALPVERQRRTRDKLRP